MSEFSSENRRYPSNQQEYFGQILSITMSCAECKEFQEIGRENLQLRVKSCTICSKEYALCFCNEVCLKTTPGSITKFNYEYLTCDNGGCDYLGVRCTNCQKLCKIKVSKDNKLFWYCKSDNQQCNFFKQHVVVSLRNHVDSCKDILFINADILCRLIFRYVDNLEYIDILKKFYAAGKLDNDELNEIRKFLIDKSPQIVNAIENDILKVHLRNSPCTPNRSVNYNEFKTILDQQGVSPTPNIASNNEIDKLNRNFRLFKDEMRENFDKMQGQTQDNFRNLEDEFKRKFSTLENELESRIEKNLSDVKTELQGLKDQTKENNDNIERNFSILFKKLKVNIYYANFY